jgi:hypothetical protein
MDVGVDVRRPAVRREPHQREVGDRCAAAAGHDDPVLRVDGDGERLVDLARCAHVDRGHSGAGQAEGGVDRAVRVVAGAVEVVALVRHDAGHAVLLDGHVDLLAQRDDVGDPRDAGRAERGVEGPRSRRRGVGRRLDRGQQRPGERCHRASARTLLNDATSVTA